MAKKTKKSSKFLKAWRKISNKNKFGLIAVLAAATIGVVLMGNSLAVTSQLNLTLSQSSTTQGTQVDALIYITPESVVDGVEAVLTYDANKLEYVSTSYEGSVFPIQLTESNAPGSVTITRGILGETVSNPDSLIAKVTFKVLAKRGNTEISLTGNATNAGSYTNPLPDSKSLNIGNAKGGKGNGKGGGSGKENNGKSPKSQETQ